MDYMISNIIFLLLFTCLKFSGDIHSPGSEDVFVSYSSLLIIKIASLY